MKDRVECRELFASGAGRAGGFWLTYVRQHQANPSEIDAELDNVVQAIVACRMHTTLWQLAAELALLLHSHMILSGRWAHWERLLNHLLANEGADNCTLVQGLLQRSLAEVYGRQGQLARAVEWVANAATACRQAGAPQPLACCLADWAHWHFEQEHYEETLALAAEAQTVAGSDGEPSVQADVLILQGRVAQHDNQINQAVQRFDTALRISAEALITSHVKSASNFLGLALIQAGRPAEALPCFVRALEIARQTGDRPGQGIILSCAGSAYLALDRFQEAQAHLEAALDITRQTENKRAELVILTRLGRIHHAQGHLDLALGYLYEALELAQQLGEQVREIEIRQAIEQAGRREAQV